MTNILLRIRETAALFDGDDSGEPFVDGTAFVEYLRDRFPEAFVDDKYRRFDGVHAHRCVSNPMERRFANAWAKINAGEHPMLGFLMNEDTSVSEALSDRDWLVASTLIQWLGSPVGMHFVTSVLSNEDGVTEAGRAEAAKHRRTP